MTTRLGSPLGLPVLASDPANPIEGQTYQTAAGVIRHFDGTAWKDLSQEGHDHATGAHNHDDLYYTESEVDTFLAGKEDTHGHPYASDTHDHDADYAPVHSHPYASDTHDHDADYSASGHTHDGRYYTEAEIDSLLAGKEDTHSHPYASDTHNHDAIYAGISADNVFTGENLFDKRISFPMPGGAWRGAHVASIQAGSSTSGALVVKKNSPRGNEMSQVHVRGYVYLEAENFYDVFVSAYWYTNGYVRRDYIDRGTRHFSQARWADDPSGNTCLILGDVGDTHAYPKFWVDAMVGHSASEADLDGWSIEFVTDLSGYTSITSVANRTAKTMQYVLDGLYADFGHSHSDLYYTEAEVDTLLAGKEDTHSHPYASDTHNHDADYAASGHTHDGRYYTETETDNLLAGKADTHSHPYAASSHSHNIINDGTINTSGRYIRSTTGGALVERTYAQVLSDIGAASSGHDHSGVYEPVHNHPYASDTHNHDADYSASGHLHDGRYYTETETDNLLAGKSDTHSHPYASTSHGHDEFVAHIEHGATASTARPSVNGPVLWYGTVEPDNWLDGDEWIDTTTGGVAGATTGDIVQYNGAGWETINAGDSHGHTPAEVGASPSGHGHTAEDVGALPTTGGTVNGFLEVLASSTQQRWSNGVGRLDFWADDNRMILRSYDVDGNEHGRIDFWNGTAGAERIDIRVVSATATLIHRIEATNNRHRFYGNVLLEDNFDVVGTKNAQIRDTNDDTKAYRFAAMEADEPGLLVKRFRNVEVGPSREARVEVPEHFARIGVDPMVFATYAAEPQGSGSHGPWAYVEGWEDGKPEVVLRASQGIYHLLLTFCRDDVGVSGWEHVVTVDSDDD